MKHANSLTKKLTIIHSAGTLAPSRFKNKQKLKHFGGFYVIWFSISYIKLNIYRNL